MSQTYFKNFNIITYANTPALDLTERIIVRNGTQYNPYQYYPLDISDGVRADMISYQNWGDPYASWILYLTNNIIDPYYDFYLTQEQFNEFIKGKYGTTVRAQNTILYYKVDWTDDMPISIAGYNALDAHEMKYYEPNYANGSFIVNYIRKKDDLTVTTNYMLQLTISGNTVAFSNNEVINISYVFGSNGTAQFVAGNSTNIIVQHGVGDAFPAPDNPNANVVIGPNSFCIGVDSGATAAITGYSFVSRNIAIDEEVFWSPVYAYDYEVEKNSGNRIINVMKSNYVPPFANRTANLLSQVIR
jgi:hypothetical protein